MWIVEGFFEQRPLAHADWHLNSLGMLPARYGQHSERLLPFHGREHVRRRAGRLRLPASRVEDGQTHAAPSGAVFVRVCGGHFEHLM